MRRTEELKNPHSCINKAHESEMVFVLLARDPVAPILIREWVKMRVAIGKNKPDDAQILEALQCADTMEKERYE